MTMSMNMKYIKHIVSILVLLMTVGIVNVNATHIVGADMTFTCNGKEWYEIHLTVRRDCLNGDEEADFDDPAFVGIFDAFGTPLNWLGSLGAVKMELLSVNDVPGELDECTPGGTAICVSEATYTGQVFLPLREKGYILGYQRCCRNQTLSNIVNPLETGNTSFVCITEESMNVCNSSPSYDAWPELFACVGDPLTIDASGTDPDGDQLSYDLYIPHRGASLATPQPIPPAGPPYDEVEYAQGFSLDNVLGSGEPLTIDPNTGIITAVPGAIGQFLVGVIMTESRNGVEYSKTRRNFQLNVLDCSGLTGVNFTAPSTQCEGLTVDFMNTSNGASSFKWNFNFPSTDMVFMSTDESPSFTYPAPGTYTVQLQSTGGEDLCRTETFRQVVVASGSSGGAAFTAPGVQCESLTVDFNNTSSLGETFKWNFNFPSEDMAFMSTEESPSFTFPAAGTYIVQLQTTSGNGACTSETQGTIIVGNGTLTPSFDNNAPECINDLITLDLSSTSSQTDPNESITSTRYEVLIDGQVFPFDGATTQAIVPCAERIDVRLIVTSSGGCTAETTKTFDNIPGSTPGPTIEFIGGNEVTTCPGQPIQLIANPNSSWTYTWTPTTGLTFTSDTDFSNPTAHPTETTTYTVSVSDGMTTVTDQITVIVASEFLDVSIANNTTTCSNEVNLTGSASNAGADNIVYDWSFDPNFSTVVARGQTVNIPLPAGVSTIYMRAGGGLFCGSNVPSITVSNDGASTISAPTSPLNTCVSSDGSVSVVSSDPNETFSVVWEPSSNITSGLTGQTVSTTALDGQTEIMLTYTATTSGGCVRTETITIPVVSDLIMDISGGGGTGCESDGTFEALSNAPIDLVNVEWSLDPNFSTILSTDRVVTGVPSGSTLYLRGNTANGCMSEAVSRMVQPNDMSLEVDAPRRICLGDTADIDLIIPDGESFTVVWSAATEVISGLNDPKVIVVGMDTGADAIVLSYTATNDEGCVITGTVEVPYSTVIPTNFDPQVVCGTNSLALSIDPIYENGDVFWDFGRVGTSTDANPTIDFGAAGTYTGILSSTMETCNFDAMDLSVEVPEILELSTDQDTDQRSCEGVTELNLGVDGMGSEVVWTDQNGNEIIVGDSLMLTDVEGLETVTATVSDTFGCTEAITFDVGVFEFDIDIEGPGLNGADPSCGEPIDLTATNNSGSDVTYMWVSQSGGVISGGDTANPSIDPAGADDLVLIVTNEEFGCSMEIPVDVDGSSGIMATINATPGTTITEGESVTLDVVTDAVGETYQWDDGNTQGSREVMPTETTTYTVLVTDENGCTAEATITITVEERLCTTFDVPTAFTPNGDGQNDELVVRSDGDLDEVDFQVIDRWGNEVFRTARQNEGWNGFHQQTGAEMAPDVFAYCLKVTCDGEETVLAGHVTLVR